MYIADILYRMRYTDCDEEKMDTYTQNIQADIQYRMRYTDCGGDVL